jgi:hypothetical protein
MRKLFYKAVVSFLLMILISIASFYFGRLNSDVKDVQAIGSIESSSLSSVNIKGLGHDSNNLLDIFRNYTSWSHSDTQNSDDTMPQALYLLRSGQYTSSYSLTDFNGDGLVDVLYHHEPGHNSQVPAYRYFAVLTNQGSNNVEVSYKCVTVQEVDRSQWTWYGDCADVQ